MEVEPLREGALKTREVGSVPVPEVVRGHELVVTDAVEGVQHRRLAGFNFESHNDEFLVTVSGDRLSLALQVLLKRGEVPREVVVAARAPSEPEHEIGSPAATAVAVATTTTNDSPSLVASREAMVAEPMTAVIVEAVLCHRSKNRSR